MDPWVFGWLVHMGTLGAFAHGGVVFDVGTRVLLLLAARQCLVGKPLVDTVCIWRLSTSGNSPSGWKGGCGRRGEAAAVAAVCVLCRCFPVLCPSHSC